MTTNDTDPRALRARGHRILAQAHAQAHELFAQAEELDAGAVQPVAPTVLVTDGGLVGKAGAAKHFGVSVSSIDRYTAEGAPCHVVGTRRRYGLAELGAWLAARGKRPTTPATKHQDDVDVDNVLHHAGLRMVGR